MLFNLNPGCQSEPIPLHSAVYWQIFYQTLARPEKELEFSISCEYIPDKICFKAPSLSSFPGFIFVRRFNECNQPHLSVRFYLNCHLQGYQGWKCSSHSWWAGEIGRFWSWSTGHKSFRCRGLAVVLQWNCQLCCTRGPGCKGALCWGTCWHLGTRCFIRIVPTLIFCHALPGV